MDVYWKTWYRTYKKEIKVILLWKNRSPYCVKSLNSVFPPYHRDKKTMVAVVRISFVQEKKTNLQQILKTVFKILLPPFEAE